MFQRLRNLWKLSEFEPANPNESYEIGTTISPIIKRPKGIVQIIKRVEPIDEFLENNGTK